jgi:hypothetical protein
MPSELGRAPTIFTSSTCMPLVWRMLKFHVGESNRMMPFTLTLLLPLWMLIRFCQPTSRAILPPCRMPRPRTVALLMPPPRMAPYTTAPPAM